jgi:hypothetical protein
MNPNPFDSLKNLTVPVIVKNYKLKNKGTIKIGTYC